jgi:hypothetical protein
MDRGFDRFDAFLRCRTQDLVAPQSEVMRDNIEASLGYARKAGEHSARFCGEARRRLGDLAEGRATA